MNRIRFLYHKYLDKNCSIGKNVRIGHGTVFEKGLWVPFVDGKRVRRKADGGISIADDVDIAGNNTSCWGVERPTRIESEVWIAQGNMIGHGVRIGRGSIIVSKVGLCGLVEIGEWCFIAAGVTIQPLKKVGSYTMIGANSNVTKDIPAGVIAYGNPCKVIRGNPWRPPL